MKTFKEYMEEKEEKELEYLNEDATEIIGKILGIATTGVLAAYGGSLLVLAAAKSYKGLENIWQNIKGTFKGGNPKDFFNKTKNNSLVKQEVNKSEENKKQYSDVLDEVYKAIEEKDFVKAREKYVALAPQYRNLPEVKQIIINEITKVLKEPPMWPPSPGNTTYKAIRNILGLAEAKASAAAVRYHTSKIMEDRTVEKEESLKEELIEEQKSMRKIIVNGKEYLWKAGKSNLYIKGKTKSVALPYDEVPGLPNNWNDIEEAQWGKYFYIHPSNVERAIKMCLDKDLKED